MTLETFLPRDKISFIYDSVLNVVVQQKQFFGRIEASDSVYAMQSFHYRNYLIKQLMILRILR